LAQGAGVGEGQPPAPSPPLRAWRTAPQGAPAGGQEASGHWRRARKRWRDCRKEWAQLGGLRGGRLGSHALGPMASANPRVLPDRRSKKVPRRPPPDTSTTPAPDVSKDRLLIDCKYANELPKPPVPKLLKALPTADRLCEYAPTQLELDYRPIIISEQDLLSRVELVDPGAYGELPARGSMPPPLPPQDAQLLRDDDVPESVRDIERKRKRLTEHTEAWHRQAFGLQLPQLVTNDVFTERQRFTTGREATEKKLDREPPGFGSAEELAGKIEATFIAAEETPVHPSKPSLKARRILPIVPDVVLWANRYKQVAFDELAQAPARMDLLWKTTPTPRATCFGYFSPEGGDPDQGSYRLAQNYYWENRGHFTRAVDRGESEAILLSFPELAGDGEADERAAEVRFVPVPICMKLRKQKAQRLDISLDTQVLNVTLQEPSAQQAQEEKERLSAVIGGEVTKEHSEASVDYVNGEWVIQGDPRSSAGSRRQALSQGGALAPPLPIAAEPAQG